MGSVCSPRMSYRRCGHARRIATPSGLGIAGDGHAHPAMQRAPFVFRYKAERYPEGDMHQDLRYLSDEIVPR